MDDVQQMSHSLSHNPGLMLQFYLNRVNMNKATAGVLCIMSTLGEEKEGGEKEI